MGMKAIFSNRLYKHKIDANFVMSMDHILQVFNQAKHFRYQAEVRELRGVKVKSAVSIHQQLKQRYRLNDYYATSAVQQGRGLLSAQKELNKVYMRNNKEQINAVKHHKPLAIERLDTTRSKVSHPYGHIKANRRMSQFAYQKMILAIKSKSEKMGVAVYVVNLAYTSQIGKMKYMKRLGVSIHMAAAYVIARRAMGFKEILPPMLYSLVPAQKQGLHHWAWWAYMTRTLSFVRTHVFYQTEQFDQSKLRSWNTLFPQQALTDVEKIGLRRLESRKTYA